MDMLRHSTEHGGSASSHDPVMPEQPKPGSDIFTKTKMCKFNLIGVCIKGSACMFAHDPAELKPVPDLFRTKICKTLINTGSCHNPECRYAHNKEELRAASVVAKPKAGRKQPQPQPVQRPSTRPLIARQALPVAPVEGFGLPLIPTEALAPLRPVGQIVPVPVAMPVGLVAAAWPEGNPLWKEPKAKQAPAVGTRRGRRGKGQRADVDMPSARFGQKPAGPEQEDSPLHEKMPDSFSTQTTGASSSGSSGSSGCAAASTVPGLSTGDESSHGSASDPDLLLHEAERPWEGAAVEVMQEGFDTDEELLFGSQDIQSQYHAEHGDVDVAHGGGVMVKNTFLEFETDAPPVLKKVHTAAGRLQEMATEEARRQS
mmetsp:Transcript_9376/g.22502  ORF Transcript_9376/g.22502 Transcript_9376/m.22502 type:complete len:372 (-) Transcript_9376:139-1254(-)